MGRSLSTLWFGITRSWVWRQWCGRSISPPDTRIRHRPRDAETVLDAARALQVIGIEVFQDVARVGSDEIEYALRTRAGMSEPSARRLLMYTADDDFVRGDLPVRRFVAQALDLQAVSAVRARTLVRGAAHELILSPRFLDCRIWMFGASDAGTIPPPEPSSEK